ncbi:colorectal mutant cancer protein [Brachionichthys hirsutus]|uniref:colorectal mutant cancer protein n=1 Tax=Brachionichthys hirsutus TaxID=412623 RepID=UPI0036043485
MFLQDFCLVRCDSLDAGSGRDREAMTQIDQMTFDSKASDPTANLEPSPAELAQCEAEMDTLLSIIAELNKKMGSLKAPSDPGDMRPSGSSRPLVPDLLSHRLDRRERSTASAAPPKPPLTGRGGGGVVWSKLQEVLSSVEDSISCKRSWAAPITVSDQVKHQEHLRAAQESWVKATQLLEDMEREFGISCPSGLSKDQNQEDILDLDTRDSALRSILQSHQEEVERSQRIINQMEEEKNKLVGFQKLWRAGSCSHQPNSGALSPDWAFPPFPGSPLLHRRTARAVVPLSVDEEGSANSCSLCPSPISLESETERLNRCIDRLRAKNERLTASLERRKGESRQFILVLNTLESECSALQMALKNCEECEGAYSELLTLYDGTKQQSVLLQTDSAGAAGDRKQMGTEELSTSFSTAGVTEENQTQSQPGQRVPELVEREADLRQKIQCLKRDRANIILTKTSPGFEGKIGPETAHLAGLRGGHGAKDNTKPPDVKREKTSLSHELISVREELADLRGLICLKEKKLRGLEWRVTAQSAQDRAGAFDPESLGEELDDCKSQQQRLCETVAKLGSDGDETQTGTFLQELQAALQRERALKKRLASSPDSPGTAPSDGSPHRGDNGEQMSRLTQAHSKALSSYRQIRRKYREQVWRLEQRMAAMTERPPRHQSGPPKASGEASECRREETVL